MTQQNKPGGYCACACTTCMEIAIGTPDQAMCLDCVAAGCDGSGDCQVDHCDTCGAWENHAEDCKGCEHGSGEDMNHE